MFAHYDSVQVSYGANDDGAGVSTLLETARALKAGPPPVNDIVFLFTDADTVHLPGSLARAVKEAEENHADMLSYSPEQIAVTFWEMAVLPVVFAELARQYPPSKVSDPASPEAAAGGGLTRPGVDTDSMRSTL